MRLAGAAGVALVLLTLVAGITATMAVNYATQADAQRNRAEEKTVEARRSALLAERNAADAKSQQHRAEQNATEAATQRKRADEKTVEATRNANEAARNADQAAQSAALAQDNAAAAQNNAVRANQTAGELDATNHTLDQKNNELANTNGDLANTNLRLQQQTVTATAGKMAARSLVDLDESYDLSLVEAVGATRLDLGAGRDALLRSLVAHPEVRRQFRPTRGDTLAAVSPSGRTLATTTVQEQTLTFQFWDTASGKVRVEGSLPKFGGVDNQNRPTFGPENKIVLARNVVAGETLKSEIDVVDTDRGTRRSFTTATLALEVAFSRDGKSIAIAGFRLDPVTLESSGVVEIWDLANTTEPREQIPTGSDTPFSIVFSPDAVSTRMEPAEQHEQSDPDFDPSTRWHSGRRSHRSRCWS